MTKFKVGDRVKCVFPDPFGRLEYGKIYIVMDTEYNGTKLVLDIGTYFHDRFVLVEDYLTTIDKPFGELDRHTQIELFGAWLDGKQIQMGLRDGSWDYTFYPAWFRTGFYRVAPETTPKTKDYIDWSAVNKKYKYLRRDKDGVCMLYSVSPVRSTRGDWWESEFSPIISAYEFASYKQGTEDWDKAGIDRPEDGCNVV